MKILIAVLVVLFPLGTTQAQAKKDQKQPSGLEKILKTMFPSTKPKVTPKKTKHYAATKKKSQTIIRPNIYVSVEPEWMAKYWEQEAAWDYEIPEDDLIRFKDGRYIVPFVVFRHYEDMLSTPRRTASTTTNDGMQ